MRRKFDQIIDRGGRRRGERGDRRIAAARNLAGSDARVFAWNRARVIEPGQKRAALSEHQRVGEHFAHIAQLGAAHAEETVIGAPLNLRNRYQIELGQQVVAFAYGTDDRILDGDDAESGARAGHRCGHLAKAGKADGRHLDPVFAQKVPKHELRVGSIDSLVDRCHCRCP